MRWIRRLRSNFGTPFLFLITSVYWTQGFRTFAWMAVSYQMKDELRLSPSASQFVVSTAFIPWSVKPIYGILSDCVPIGGNRRVPYLIIASILSFIPWFLLGRVDALRASYIYLTLLLTTQNFGAAMADVVVDAMVAETARSEFAGDLQSLSWLAMAFGGILGSISGGLGLSVLSVEGIFLLFSIFPLLQLVACGLIEEKSLGQLTIEIEEEDRTSLKEDDGETFKFEVLEGAQRSSDNGLISMISEEGGISIEVSNIFIETEKQGENDAPPLETRICEDGSGENLGVGGRQKQLESQKGEGEDLQEDKDWIQIGVDGLEETTVEKPSQCNGADGQDLGTRRRALDKLELLKVGGVRKRSPSSIGEDMTRMLESLETTEAQLEPQRRSNHDLRSTFVALLEAVKQPAIMQPMLWFMISQVVIPNLSTMMFYYQTNHLYLDSSFLGTSRVIGWGGLMFGTFLYTHYLKHVSLRKLLWFMPFLVLSGQLCPPGIEGTLFALFMSLNNLGANLSSINGAALASALKISSETFDNLSLGIFFQAVCTVIPNLFLFLVPAVVTGASNRALEHRS